MKYIKNFEYFNSKKPGEIPDPIWPGENKEKLIKIQVDDYLNNVNEYLKKNPTANINSDEELPNDPRLWISSGGTYVPVKTREQAESLLKNYDLNNTIHETIHCLQRKMYSKIFPKDKLEIDIKSWEKLKKNNYIVNPNDKINLNYFTSISEIMAYAFSTAFKEKRGIGYDIYDHTKELYNNLPSPYKEYFDYYYKWYLNKI